MLLNRILGKTSKSAVDASLLYAARCKTPNREYVEVLSASATEEGREAAEQFTE